MMTPGGLYVPEQAASPPQPEPAPRLVMSGRGGIRLPEYDDGYHGYLSISKLVDGQWVVVRLPVTEKQALKLSAMGIEEYT